MIIWQLIAIIIICFFIRYLENLFKLISLQIRKMKNKEFTKLIGNEWFKIKNHFYLLKSDVNWPLEHTEDVYYKIISYDSRRIYLEYFSNDINLKGRNNRTYIEVKKRNGKYSIKYNNIISSDLIIDNNNIIIIPSEKVEFERIS